MHGSGLLEVMSKENHQIEQYVCIQLMSGAFDIGLCMKLCNETRNDVRI